MRCLRFVTSLLGDATLISVPVKVARFGTRSSFSPSIGCTVYQLPEDRFSEGRTRNSGLAISLGDLVAGLAGLVYLVPIRSSKWRCPDSQSGFPPGRKVIELEASNKGGKWHLRRQIPS